MPATSKIDTGVESVDKPLLAPEPADTTSAVCVELEKVRTLSNEMSLITNSAMVELTGSGGVIDEAAVLARLREASDLLEQSLPTLLGAYEAAALVAPTDVAADLRALAGGTAVLTPALAEFMRNAATIQELAGIEQLFERPDLADAAYAAGTAALRLNGFTIPSCGFQLSN